MILRGVLVCAPNTASREADPMRKLTFGMNLSLDGYITAPGDDLGWSVPSDELFQWWSDRGGGTGPAGRWGGAEGGRRRAPRAPPPPSAPAPPRGSWGPPAAGWICRR